MLRTLKQEEFEQYAEFAFSLVLDLSKSSYPTYTDGIKTKEDFIRTAKKALEKENEEILLFFWTVRSKAGFIITFFQKTITFHQNRF